MIRKVRVQNALKERSEKITYKHLAEWMLNGHTTEELANTLSLSRTNVSHDLNELVKSRRAFSIKSRPVLFFDREVIENKFDIVIKEKKLGNIDELISMIKHTKKQTEAEDVVRYSNDFSIEGLIGYKGSLREQIEQGKSAILYPPNGLHMLLTGSTGVGKTMFARLLYKLGIDCGRYNEHTPFVMFNCADYSNNPQLLMSQLFGHIKGAYTGADKDKIGLVEKANGGILCLDEIHRLPQEGQEMLFSIFDHGRFRRLGESESTRSVNVLIIGATTEDIGEVLLGTYVRRIPVVIKFPNLKDRPLIEREKLVKRFFWEESKKIKNDIYIPKEILSVYMLYKCPGNIGQLKSDIQLVCANAYLRYITKQTQTIKVERKVLTDNMKIAHQNIYAYLAEQNADHDLASVKGIWSTAEYNRESDLSILAAERTLTNADIELCEMDNIFTVFEQVCNISIYECSEMTVKDIRPNIIEFSRFINEYLAKATGNVWGNEFVVLMACFVYYFLEKRVVLDGYTDKITSADEGSDYYEIAYQISNFIQDNFEISTKVDQTRIIARLLEAYEVIVLRGEELNSVRESSNELDVRPDDILQDAYKYIKDTIVFVNPHKLYPLVLTAIKSMELKSYRQFSLSIKIRLVIHISFSVERLLLRNEVPHKDAVAYSSTFKDEISQIKNSLKDIHENFNVEYSIHELSYIYDILQ